MISSLKKYHQEIEDTLRSLMLDSMILDLPNHITFVQGNISEDLKEKAIREFILYITNGNEKTVLDQRWLVWKKDL